MLPWYPYFVVGKDDSGEEGEVDPIGTKPDDIKPEVDEQLNQYRYCTIRQSSFVEWTRVKKNNRVGR